MIFHIFLVSLFQISKVLCDYELIQAVIVSRHGIRTPYGPPYGNVTDFTAYTNKKFPTNTDWGMSFDAFANQHLTPHGEKIIPYFGAYYFEKFISQSFDLSSCENIICFADASTRDIQTAGYWLDGFGCGNVPVYVANSTSYPEMQPVLSDNYNIGCPLATEEQVDGLYGGDVDALTGMYSEGIQLVMDVLNMPADASLCEQANPDFVPGSNCTMFDTGYEYTGVYYEGMFVSPLYYAQYFPEAWMLQFVSNLTNWAFGLLSVDQLRDLYAMHTETLWFGSNYWLVTHRI